MYFNYDCDHEWPTLKLQFTYSKLKRFLTCPRQYQETYVTKNFKDQPNEKSIYGKEVHKALENYVKLGQTVPGNYKKFQGIVDSVIGLTSPIGSRHTELELAFNQDFEKCEYRDDENYMCRGVVDLLLLDNDTGWMFDYKLGKTRYYDLRQLSLLSLLVFVNYPQVQTIRSGLIFLAENQFIPHKNITRDQIPLIWDNFIPDLLRLVYSYQKSDWPAIPSGLCRGWCPVKTCEFYREKGY